MKMNFSTIPSPLSTTAYVHCESHHSLSPARALNLELEDLSDKENVNIHCIKLMDTHLAGMAEAVPKQFSSSKFSHRFREHVANWSRRQFD